MENSKRATVYFSPDVPKALRLRAAAADRSMLDMVNDAVRMVLAEDRIHDRTVRKCLPDMMIVTVCDKDAIESFI